MRRMTNWMLLALLLTGSLLAAACDGQTNRVEIDGSSTVFPITEAVADEFQNEHDARVTIGVSGTGGGFKKFCRGETAINDASRPIKPIEIERCNKNDIDFIEIPVAYDGISVVTHSENDWADTVSVSELKKIWEPDAQNSIDKWSQVRDDWPDEELHLYGAGTDSGTYDYFTHAIVGEEGASRGDFTSSEDDNVLVKGVSSDEMSLGFFGFAYYKENDDKLQALAIREGESGEGVLPSHKTIANGEYQPLSRPLFIYVKASAADDSNIQEFVNYYLTKGGPLVEDVGYVALPDRTYEKALKRFENRTTGSMFGGEGAKVGVSVESLLDETSGGSK